MEASWQQQGRAHNSNVTKWLPQAYDKASAAVRKAQWRVLGGTAAGYTAGVGATIVVADLQRDLDLSANAMKEVMAALDFSQAMRSAIASQQGRNNQEAPFAIQQSR